MVPAPDMLAAKFSRRRWLDPIRFALTPDARAQRVIAIVLASILMSAGDLYMTLTYVTNIGMIELNPLARQLMAWNSPMAVVAWKLALTLFGAGVLLAFRKRRSTEVAAWLVFASMTWLIFHWRGFNTEVADMTEEYQMLSQIGDERFVHMAE